MDLAGKFLFLLLLLFYKVELKPISEDNVVLEDLENGEYFQGDIELTPKQEKIFFTDSPDFGPRTGYFGSLWPKKRGKVRIPYDFDETSEYSKFIGLS
jgi:hypothetical protein